MKPLTFITFLLLSFWSFAGKPYNIHVTVVDIESHTPIPGVRIDFMSDKNRIVFYTYTDKEGKASCENSKQKIVKIETSSKNNEYSNTTYYLNKKENEFTVVLALTNFQYYYDQIKRLTVATPIDSAFLADDEKCGDSLINAEFPGGQEGLFKFLRENIRYPTRALDEGIGGRCYLRFYVDQNGKISNIVVSRGVPGCPECDLEAVKVITKMPKWTPGVCQGGKVGMFYNLPIKFTPG